MWPFHQEWRWASVMYHKQQGALAADTRCVRCVRHKSLSTETTGAITSHTNSNVSPAARNSRIEAFSSDRSSSPWTALTLAVKVPSCVLYTWCHTLRTWSTRHCWLSHLIYAVFNNHNSTHPPTTRPQQPQLNSPTKRPQQLQWMLLSSPCYILEFFHLFLPSSYNNKLSRLTKCVH